MPDGVTVAHLGLSFPCSEAERVEVGSGPSCSFRLTDPAAVLGRATRRLRLRLLVRKGGSALDINSAFMRESPGVAVGGAQALHAAALLRAGAHQDETSR